MLLNFNEYRKDYLAKPFDTSDADPNPFAQFAAWFRQAEEAGIEEPNAMTLASADAEGRVSARIVLLKAVENEAFVFFTNYGSRKGAELDANPAAALVFFWKELARQVRVEGRVSRIDPLASTEYFQSRPKGSQIGAWASPQSTVIPDRAFLESRVAALEQQYATVDKLPRPESWGGYMLVPDRIEFWQGRPSRLHDRIHYFRPPSAISEWQRERLAP